MSTRHACHRLLSLLCCVCLLIGASALATAPAAAQQPAEQPAPAAPARLYRTTVGISQPTQLQRLQRLGAQVLVLEGTQASVLVNELQLEALVQRGFQPHATVALYDLIIAQPHDSVRQLAQATPAQQQAELGALATLDDDGDGLTNTQEQWWCTDANAPDTDSDGRSDGAEIAALKTWLRNGASRAPNETPWPNWPSQRPGCEDKDRDSIPNLAERWELGLSMDLESSDRDKFDDGQELFGVTHCPGGDASCGYGDLPRSSDTGYVGAVMPSWVKPPGNHPFAAAFPLPEIDVVANSLTVERVTTITTERGEMQLREKTYSTAKTQGTSTSVANTTTWNEWQEVSRTDPINISYSSSNTGTHLPLATDSTNLSKRPQYGSYNSNAESVICSANGGLSLVKALKGEIFGALGKLSKCGKFLQGLGQYWIDDTKYMFQSMVGSNHIMSNPDDNGQTGSGGGGSWGGVNKCEPQIYGPCGSGMRISGDLGSNQSNYSNDLLQNQVVGSSSNLYNVDGGGRFSVRQQYPIAFAINQPLPTQTVTSGSSRGGAQTNTHTQYEEHTVTNGEAFTTGEDWRTATAVDSAHAADLTFSYQVRNNGSEYAREIRDLAFNVYLGDNPNPIYTYFVGPDLGGDGAFRNFMPGEARTFATSRRIPLSLAQMQAIDTGAALRIVAENFSYGVDELFYQNAVGSAVQLAIEDGSDDGDETIERFLVPTFGGETLLDLLARSFPSVTDSEDNLVAIWTPEYRPDTPAWCDQPRRSGTTLLCRHALSTADWWNVYLDGLGDGSEAFQDTPAAPNTTALFRFNSDSDLDGYSDRSEWRMGTDAADPADFPRPELIAGLHTSGDTSVGSTRVATLSLLNTGLYDAYGVEAVLVAPDDSVTITNNTVGGSGRVRAQGQVIVGSKIAAPAYTSATWRGTAKPSVGGYFTGTADRSYSFTVQCPLASGCKLGEGDWSLAWSDTSGNTGSLELDSAYRSPQLRSVGALGVQIAMLSGSVFNGDRFTLDARTPRDTFQYTINRPDYTPPVAIVSYNDPQGNHRFVTPVQLNAPADNLAAFSGQMLPNPGVEIVTTSNYAAGQNTTNLVVNNPANATLTNAKLFLEFIDAQGTVVAEVPTTATLPTGPSVVPVTWDTGAFSPGFDPTQEYIVMAFWTDYQGNILATAGRPLSSFQTDPQPVLALEAADDHWDFGSAPQGTLLKRRFSLANTGQLDLQTYLSAPPELRINQQGARMLNPADVADYEIALNTAELPAGAYDKTITIRTSDPANPTRTVRVSGTISAASLDTATGAIQRPLDVAVAFASGTQGTWVEYTHTLGPQPERLQPVKVYSQEYARQWGVGKYATAFGSGTSSADMFGDGRDGPMPSGGTLDTNNGIGYGTVNGTIGNNQISIVDRHGIWRVQPGDYVLIYQTRGAGAGTWELNRAASDVTGSGTFALERPLKQTYTTSGYENWAQVVRVPQYSTCNVTGTVTPLSPWNGVIGGIITAMCRDGMTLSGTISADAAGFRGGRSGNGYEADQWQGESILSPGNEAQFYYQRPDRFPSAQGGGAADHIGGGGGGGGYSAGNNGDQIGGSGWGEGGRGYGATDASTMFFGGGGGGGATSIRPGTGYSQSGSGGGLIFLFVQSLAVTTGRISASGQQAVGVMYDDGTNRRVTAGSGGGGQIFIRAGTATLGANQITAVGAPQLPPPSGGGRFGGGAGGAGRTYIEYCDAPAGSTNPPASGQKLSCYIAEQVEAAPYTSGRLNLPETFSDGRTYQVQYGRQLVFTASGSQLATLRVPAAAFASATLDALLSGTGGAARLRLDIGNDGVWHCDASGDGSVAATLPCPNLAAAFSAYWSRQGAPTNAPVDVPVNVELSTAGQVLLSNLQVAPAGSTLRTLRLPAGTYSAVSMDLVIGERSSVGQGTIAADVGDDGTIDWTWSDAPSYPLQRTTGNLAQAINALLAGRSGEVNLPFRFSVTPGLPLRVVSFSATATAQPDLALSAADIGFDLSNPTEGEVVPVRLRLHNSGAYAASGVTASLFATAPGWGETYVGSAFVANIPAGGTSTAIVSWNTLGFTGTVPLRVVTDPFNRLAESNENNNAASASFTVRTRPDLRISAIALSDDEPTAGVPVSATLTLRADGQTSPAGQRVTLYQGIPGAGGIEIGSQLLPALAAGSDTSVRFTWVPTTTGSFRLLARADAEGQVSEADEGNNDTWRDVYAGLRGPIELDSGSSGNDPTYTTALGYGVVDTGQPDAVGNCGSEPAQTYRRDPSGSVQYRFDHLQPGHFYHLDLVLYECGQGASRQEYVKVDGITVAGPEDLGDNGIHQRSILIDPALYGDRTIVVTVESYEGLGALVNAITLHDIDYRYADAGGKNDAQYPGTRGFGWLDAVSSAQQWGPLPYQSARVDQNDNEIRYRFDQLDPLKKYQLSVSFYQGSGTNRVQQVLIDGQVRGGERTIISGQRYSDTLTIPLNTYAIDNSIVVSVKRTNAAIGPIVNQVALEELTATTPPPCQVRPTPAWRAAYGRVTIQGVAAPADTLVTAENMRGEVVGCFIVEQAGDYGLMTIYGEDSTATPPIGGMREGEKIIFRVDGALAVATPVLAWSDDKTPYAVDLEAGVTPVQNMLLTPGWNLVSWHVEPPVPEVGLVLQSLSGKYCRVLSERAIYDCTVPEVFRTLRDLPGNQGYYLRLEGSASAILQVEGKPIAADTPIALHPGWNWIGYLPHERLPVTTALRSIEGQYLRVADSNGRIYDPALSGFNTLTHMEPGRGYLIYATASTTLTYPAATAPTVASAATARSEEGNALCAHVAPTPAFTLLYGSLTLNGVPAPAGTQVEARTAGGAIAGCVVVTQAGQYGFLPIFGTDGGANATPGYADGEPLVLRVNGAPIAMPAELLWNDDKTPQRVDLDVAATWQLYLPLLAR